MAQGKLKTKVQVPAASKRKGQHPKKHVGAKKGGRAIAPKKSRHVEAVSLKKNLARSINKKIEQEVIAKASNSEYKSLATVKSPEMSKAKK